MRFDTRGAFCFGLNMIVWKRRGHAPTSKELPRPVGQGHAIGVAGLLDLRATSLVARRLIAPQPVEEAMGAQVLQRPPDRVTRAPQLQHEGVDRRLQPARAEINEIGEQLQQLDRHASQGSIASTRLPACQFIASCRQHNRAHVLSARPTPEHSLASSARTALPPNGRAFPLGWRSFEHRPNLFKHGPFRLLFRKRCFDRTFPITA